MNKFESFDESDIQDIVMAKTPEIKEKEVVVPSQNIPTTRVFIDKYGRKITETTDIKEVPSKILFTDKTIWRVTNECTQRRYEVNGGIINFWLSGIPDIRVRLETGQMSSFKTLNMFVEFVKAVY